MLVVNGGAGFFLLAALDLRDLESLSRFQGSENRGRLTLVADDGFLAVEQVQLGSELLSVFFEQRFDCPVLDGLESSNLPLALNQKAKCNGLHATGGDSLLHRLPQDGAGFVANQSIEHATRLLRVDLAFVDVAGVGKRVLHCITSDLVKQNPTHRRAVSGLDLLRDVPGNRLALAIRIRREENFLR